MRLLFAIILALTATWSVPASAALCDSFKTITANYTVVTADAGACIRADATAGTINITLPAATVFGAGSVSFKKVDTSSNLVFINGTLEEGMTSLPLTEGYSVTESSNGISSAWELAAPSLQVARCSNYASPEHDITALSYIITPAYCGYLLLVDTCSAGGSVYMGLPAMSDVAFHHQTFAVRIMKFDSCATSYVVSVVANSTSDPIVWNHVGLAAPGLGKIDLVSNYQLVEMWTDGARWTVPQSYGF